MTVLEYPTDRVVCEVCGERMRPTKNTMLWCRCGRLVSNADFVYVDFP